MKRMLITLMLLGVCGLSLTACGGKGKKKARVKVSGLVTLDGRALKQASVYFVATDGDGTGAGMTDDNGRYELMVPPGSYKVTIGKTEGGGQGIDLSDPHTTMQEFENPNVEQKKGPKQLVPAKYSDAAETTLKMDVPDGGRDDADFTNLVSK